jgi:predicted TIM-barrel fold metal-dependent hydrolase
VSLEREPSGRSGGPIVIDAHQHVGSPGQAGFDTTWAAADLVARRSQMESMGLDRCVILPAPSGAGGFRNVDHAAMNDSIAEYAHVAGELVQAVAATVNPAEPLEACRELERAFGLLAMSAVVFHHRYLGMQINDARMDDIVRVASEHGRTVFVHIISDSTFEAPWRLFALAKRFPEARFLALDGFSSAAQSMMLREWAPDVGNVWFDTGAMTSVAHGLEAFLDRCGPDRLVLGTDLYSGHPHFRVAMPAMELRSMGLSVEALDAICRANILSLLEPAQH